MDDKYFKLQDIVVDTFDLDSPVEIENGVLLLEKTSKNVFLQLKLNVLETATSRLSSVTLRIDCLDDAKETITDISPYTFTYRDIFLNKSKTFGEDNPILLDQRVRRVKVGIHRIVFTDSTTWSPTGRGFTPSKQELLNSLKPELVEQFQRDIRSLLPAVKENYKYIPNQLGDYWLCTCGRPNATDVEICSRCGLSKELVFNISEDTLLTNLDEYKERIRIEEEKARIVSEQAKLQAIERARIKKEQVRLLEINKARERDEDIARLHEVARVREKRKKSILLVTALVAVIIVVFIFAIIPAIKYSQASNYLANKDFDNAISVYSSLSEYKNSKDMVYEANYQKAVGLVAGNKYTDAIQIFRMLGDYKDTTSLLLEANYQLALILLNESQRYDEAVTIFISLGDYKDSANLLIESNYQKAVDLLANKKAEDALSIFVSLRDYKDSSSMIIESKYQKALKAYKDGDFTSAQIILDEIPNYQDSGNYLHNLKILIAVQGTWKELHGFHYSIMVFDKWDVYRQVAAGNEYIGHILLKENYITENGLVFEFASDPVVFNYSKQSLTRDDYDGLFELTKISNEREPYSSSSSSSSPSSSSSSSSECETLWNNLDLALLLSGGETTDLTVYYTKALMDNDCFD